MAVLSGFHLSPHVLRQITGSGPVMTDQPSMPTGHSFRWLVSQVVARVGTIETLIAQREIGDDVALDHRFQQRPLEP
jgi:hypothetical protein